MMNAKHEELTAGERRYLEHARRAREKGLSMSEYCRLVGMSSNALYSMRRQMREKGILEPTASPKHGEGSEFGAVAAVSVPSRFVAVRVAQGQEGSLRSAAGIVCRLRHASGWLIECGSWPAAQWLRELVREASDACP